MRQGIEEAVTELLGSNVPHFDPRDGDLAEAVFRVADGLLHEFPDGEFAPGSGGTHTVEINRSIPLFTQLSIKLARSKAAVRLIQKPVRVSVVFAMYKEHTRMLRPDEHPHGEDFLLRKIAQLHWLFDDTPVEWRLIAVDDGCPEGSGLLAQKILKERAPDEPITVLFLKDALAEELEVVSPMTMVSESQKGGSIIFGMWHAAVRHPKNHLVVFTDADLSVDLGQTGLLVDGILRNNKNAAIASRRQPESAVVKTGHRNTRGKLFIYLWKGLLGPLRYITDTQCGFKAFRAEQLLENIETIAEKGFAFDLELLLVTELGRSQSIEKVPIAWIDSEAASTTTDLEPYLSMLRSAVAMYRKYLPQDPKSNSIAQLIEDMTESDWTYLSEHIPGKIAEADPRKFGEPMLTTIEELVSIAKRSG
ncbi:MAG: hypothetical protein HKN33_07465 [Pyrinomonadaceae bacterium]|nr:hypothetical protein [Pyrinomonadaceae bacterium]